MSQTLPSPSRHIHRNAVDSEGSPFLVAAIVWRGEKAMSIRCWSTDGKAKKVHQYFPKDAISKFGNITHFLKDQGYEVVDNENIEIPSIRWKELVNLRTVKILKEATKKVEDGWVTSVTYLQPWFGWEFTITTKPMISKQLSMDAIFPVFDIEFASCARLLKDVEAIKSAKLLEW